MPTDPIERLARFYEREAERLRRGVIKPANAEVADRLRQEARTDAD